MPVGFYKSSQLALSLSLSLSVRYDELQSFLRIEGPYYVLLDVRFLVVIIICPLSKSL